MDMNYYEAIMTEEEKQVLIAETVEKALAVCNTPQAGT